MEFLVVEAIMLNEREKIGFGLLGLANKGEVQRKGVNVDWVIEHGFMKMGVKGNVG